ncbi:tetratricopeptide repeat protein [Bdellovibrio sp. HCB274]|uniref:tetratricopeptide repeat protein n=1 Tax=Bdellovibrio sp. HCB274 TaxID=3394361 RepID=UPI0039B4EA7D
MNKPMKAMLVLPLLCSTALAQEVPKALNVKSQGAPAAANLRVKSSLVPTFEIYQKKVVKGKTEVFKVKAIPELNIGAERAVEAIPLTPLRLPASQQLVVKEVKKAPAINPMTVKIPPYTAVVHPPKVVTSPDAFNKIPDVKMLAAVKEPSTVEPQTNLMKMDDMKPNDYKLLQALIFLEIQQKYEMAMGLFSELMDDKDHRLEALYNYAMTAKGLGLNTEFRTYMIKVSQESKNKEWQERATKALVEGITALEQSDIALIDPLVTKYELDVSKNADYQITRAKYYSSMGNLGMMEDALMLIDEKSPKYPEALLLSGLFNYRQNKVDEATVNLEALLKATDGDKKSQIRNVGAITMARIQFQKSLYKEAFQSYLKVDRSSPLWLQAMTESAWTQILSEDYEGAAGNMFSLHTDFFKNAFNPESFVVRTVGYLNLCQYGDGVQVLEEMRGKYGPWKGKLEAYNKAHKKTIDYYDTVKNWAKNSDLKEVDGLPRAFIVELARHPGFMSIQKQINNYEDEITKFNKISFTLINLEKEFLSKKAEASKDLAAAKAKNRDTQSAEKKLLSYQIQYHIANKARTSIKALRTQGIARIEKEKDGLRGDAGKALQSNFKNMVTNLNRVLDQNDVLQYELYSGAGEHIRYQMAGGDVNDKERPELKVAKEKSLNWKFKGEIWEDEVGHYRSSLKNVCPQDNSVAGMNEH